MCPLGLYFVVGIYLLQKKSESFIFFLSIYIYMREYMCVYTVYVAQRRGYSKTAALMGRTTEWVRKKKKYRRRRTKFEKM